MLAMGRVRRENDRFDLDQKICRNKIGGAYSVIKNRDYPAARKVIAFDRFTRYLKYSCSAGSGLAEFAFWPPAKVGYENQMDR
jgi:hypothetical protein